MRIEELEGRRYVVMNIRGMPCRSHEFSVLHQIAAQLSKFSAAVLVAELRTL